MNARTIFAIAGTLALASAAMAQETINFVTLNGGSVASEGVRTGALSTNQNPVLNYSFLNSFLWNGSVTIQGTLRRNVSGDFVSENRIAVTSTSNGASSSPDIQAGTVSSFPSTPLAINRTMNLTGFTGTPFNPQGQSFAFRFYNSANDGGTVVDSFWDACTVTFNAFVVPTAPVAINLGNVSNNSYPVTQTGTLASGQVTWYRFNIAANTVLDIHTFFSGVGNTQTDTEIGLYSSTGALVATNDDLGLGIASGLGNFNSAISTGGGSGVDLDGSGPGAPLGSNISGLTTNVAGFLAAGDYYIAVAGFNSTFNATGWDVTAGTATGPFSLTLIPTPGAAAVLGLGALAAARRRRAEWLSVRTGCPAMPDF